MNGLDVVCYLDTFLRVLYDEKNGEGSALRFYQRKSIITTNDIKYAGETSCLLFEILLYYTIYTQNFREGIGDALHKGECM